MKRLSAFLVLALVVCNALAQSPSRCPPFPFGAEQARQRQKVLAGWLGTVRAVESKYKTEYGVYGDLAALRKAHLLDSLVFESDKPTESVPDTNFVPESTHFEVTAPSDGKHYRVSIWEEINADLNVGASGNERGAESSIGCVHRPPETWDATPT